MPALVLLVLFLCGLVAALLASEALVRSLDRSGAALGWQEGLLGLLTALGADAPEIASAILSARLGAPDIGVGVVLGSNLFNLAALLGISALLTGHIRVRRARLALNGGMVLVSTTIVAILLAGWLSPPAALLLTLLVFVPYVLLLSLPPHTVAALRWPRRLARLLAAATSEIGHEVKVAHDPGAGSDGGRFPWRAAVAIVPSLALIVLGSDGMVEAALRLATRWDLPRPLVGTVLLAGLTSVPNAYAAVRLAGQHRASAVVSEAFNSNTINVLAGLCLPALGGGLPPLSAVAPDVLWLLAMTALSVALLAPRRGLTRSGAAALLALYAAFALHRAGT